MLGGFDWTHPNETVENALLEEQIPNVDVVFISCGHGCNQPLLDASAKTVTEAQAERSAGAQDAGVLVFVIVGSLYT